jgi:glycosyltransferase involved in cell wall biosynthesis
VREGRQWSVHLHAFRRYRSRLRGQFDAVIDETNTIPFFTPLWAGIPVFLMIWQLAREVWWYESRFPVNALGYALEPLYLRLYRQTPVLTFSASTLADLRGLGFRSDITVVPVGVEAVEIPDEPKTGVPTFIYVGRLAPSKRVHEILEAFALFRHEHGSGRLVLVGNGPKPYVLRLERMSARLGVADSVEFCGWLHGAAKHERMAQAHALVMASAREGWGLVVTECNLCGTPAIVYDVPGLRDSVRQLETGLVVRPSPSSLAEGMLRLVRDQDTYARMREEASRWSRTFTYDAGTRVVLETLGQELARTAT